MASIQAPGVRRRYWVINGSIYITNAAAADWLYLLAVDPEAGYGGFSQMIAKGFSYQLLDKIGNWGSDTGLLFFENVRVPVANTIGDIGRGFQQQMMQFQDERLVVRQHRGRRAPVGSHAVYCEERGPVQDAGAETSSSSRC